jgi:uncharacterized protein (DUF2141 family)
MDSLAAIALGVLLSFKVGNTPLTTNTLKVEVSNYTEDAATKVWISVFSKNDFLQKSIQTRSVSATGEKVIVAFDLPPGEYAVSTYHDVNKNNELDRYFFGKPKEPYGFSNNVKPLGPPSFEKCKFTLNPTSRTISIRLID